MPQGNVLSGMLFYCPTVSPFNPDGSYKENYTRREAAVNPLSLANKYIIKTNDTKTLINGLAQVDILPGLRFTLTGSTQKDQNNINAYENSKSGLAVNANELPTGARFIIQAVF